MKPAFRQTEQRLAVHDQKDALSVIQAATVLAALPALMSPAARELATQRLRELGASHPQAAEFFAAIVLHLEQYP